MPSQFMEIQGILRFADELVFAKTGKHLDDVQTAILQGTLEGKKYADIAEEAHCTEGYAKDVGSKLWQTLSEALGEDVNKSNLKTTLQRHQFSNINFGNGSYISQMTVCGDVSTANQASQQPDPASPSTSDRTSQSPTRQDLANAPELRCFYNRDIELKQLQKWILQDACRLVMVQGLQGIGKTALAVKLIQEIQQEFDCIFWRSLRYSPFLEEIQHSFMTFLEPDREVPAERTKREKLLIDDLRQHRCLVVLDDIHNVFASGELAGSYKEGFQEYGFFWRQVWELSHASCFLLLGWEVPREIVGFQSQQDPVRSLFLSGLQETGKKILQDQGLQEIQLWDKLIEYYQGNPLWLRSLATAILELFDGDVSLLLECDRGFVTEEVGDSLATHLSRLSPSEWDILNQIATSSHNVTIAELLQQNQISASTLFRSLQSLKRRSLLDKTTPSFCVYPILQAYLQSNSN